jgi:hypothetical protein
MALLQIIQSENGVPATYWRITSVTFNLDGSYTVTLDGFFDESARKQNYESLKTIVHTISKTDILTSFPLGFNLPDAYNYLKTLTKFSFGSVNI